MLDEINKSRATKNKIKTLLRQMYELGMDMDIVNKDYSQGLDITTEIESIERVPFSPEEIARLWGISKTDELLVLNFTKTIRMYIKTLINNVDKSVI